MMSRSPSLGSLCFRSATSKSPLRFLLSRPTSRRPPVKNTIEQATQTQASQTFTKRSLKRPLRLPSHSPNKLQRSTFNIYASSSPDNRLQFQKLKNMKNSSPLSARNSNELENRKTLSFHQKQKDSFLFKSNLQKNTDSMTSTNCFSNSVLEQRLRAYRAENPYQNSVKHIEIVDKKVNMQKVALFSLKSTEKSINKCRRTISKDQALTKVVESGQNLEISEEYRNNPETDYGIERQIKHKFAESIIQGEDEECKESIVIQRAGNRPIKSLWNFNGSIFESRIVE